MHNIILDLWFKCRAEPGKVVRIGFSSQTPSLKWTHSCWLTSSSLITTKNIYLSWPSEGWQLFVTIAPKANTEVLTLKSCEIICSHTSVLQFWVPVNISDKWVTFFHSAYGNICANSSANNQWYPMQNESVKSQHQNNLPSTSVKDIWEIWLMFFHNILK